MTTKELASPGILNALDIEQIERIIRDNRDEMNMSIARALERMAERLGRIE